MVHLSHPTLNIQKYLCTFKNLDSFIKMSYNILKNFIQQLENSHNIRHFSVETIIHIMWNILNNSKGTFI